MATITDPPPKRIAAKLHELRDRLDERVPAKQVDRNLLIATWNIRAFGGMTERWESRPGDSPRRDLHDVRRIAEIVSRFDVVALQEVKGNLKALRHMLKALGPEWGVILTDVARGRPGNDERIAFVFDTRRVKPSGLACELVLPVRDEAEAVRQFARTPYAVSFSSVGHTFILVTLHVVYGKRAQERTEELVAIAQWLAGWAGEVSQWGHNLLCLGDFNIDRLGDPRYDAFVSTGLLPAPELNDVPRSIFQRPGQEKFYDQIAWFTGGRGPVLSLRCTDAGSFDFTEGLLDGMRKLELSWRISDHYPLWAEFAVRD